MTRKVRGLLSVMLSPEEIAKIRAGIKWLEKARDESTDGRIRKLIEAWIEETQKLASGKNPE